MKYRRGLAVAVLLLLTIATACKAEVTVTADHNSFEDATADFRFPRVPPPSRSDAATEARFTIAAGRADRAGGGVEKFHDGRVPNEGDQPSENFFFAAGTEGGRVVVDLGRAIEIEQINTYSWHPATRAPQVYTLYASDGSADSVQRLPEENSDPTARGWQRIAEVDTRIERSTGRGQHGVSISSPDGILGTYRYLLFDIAVTEKIDPFGNTFFSEIDVVQPDSRRVAARPANQSSEVRQRDKFVIDGGKYHFTIDTTEAPDLTEWARGDLAPVITQWYPTIVELLPSEGYDAPREFSIHFSATMRGVAATGGNRVQCAANWFRRELEGEAKGAIVHELVHVVQNYGRARRTTRHFNPTPGWLVEGIADYIRWFLYEPQSRGAEITRRNIGQARYNSGYRITANFLNWAMQNYHQDLVKELNAAAREGKYRDDLWVELTGHTVQELGVQWKEEAQKQIDEQVRMAARHYRPFN